jgi:hypothetical protein
LEDKGGVVPGGKIRKIVCITDVTWATAEAILAVGWKKILITLTPFID